MAVSGVQGQLVEVTVIGCTRLRDTEWFSRQDPYVCVEYGSNKFRTKTCTDGGKNPSFQEKFVIPLIEGLREVVVVVWNSNTITMDEFIGSGRIQLQKVLSEGYDDSSWPLQGNNGTFAGDIRVIMHFQKSNVNKPSKSLYASTAQGQYNYSNAYTQGPPPGYPPTGNTYYPWTPPAAAPTYPPTSVWPPPLQPAAIYPPPVYPALPGAYPQAPYPTQTYPPAPYPGQYPGAYPPY